MHHCAAAFTLMKMEELDILAGMTKDDRKRARECIIDMVLATDMGEHGKLLGMFKVGQNSAWVLCTRVAECLSCGGAGVRAMPYFPRACAWKQTPAPFLSPP